jgi:hypothetical protein
VPGGTGAGVPQFRSFSWEGRQTPVLGSPASAPPSSIGLRAPVFVYAVLDGDDDEAIELFVRREDAEAFLEDVRQDDAELAEQLQLEAVELDA